MLRLMVLVVHHGRRSARGYMESIKMLSLHSCISIRSHFLSPDIEENRNASVKAQYSTKGAGTVCGVIDALIRLLAPKRRGHTYPAQGKRSVALGCLDFVSFEFQTKPPQYGHRANSPIKAPNVVLSQSPKRHLYQCQDRIRTVTCILIHYKSYPSVASF